MVYYGKFNVLGLNITACDYEYLLHSFLRNTNKTVYSPIASHPIMLSEKNAKLRDIYNSFNYLLPDSQYVRWALKHLYKVTLPDRIYGPTFLRMTLDICERKKIKIYLCGNNINLVEKEIIKQNPKIFIAGKKDTSNLKVSKIDTVKLSKEIRESNAGAVYIGIGSPAQHILAKKLVIRKRIVCVGAAFDFLSGKQKQCPKLLGDIGLEWAYRLLRENRLIKRYIYDGIGFFFKVISQ